MDNAKIDAIVQILAPYPWFREEKRKRLKKPMDDRAVRDFQELSRAIKKAERILAVVLDKPGSVL